MVFLLLLIYLGAVAYISVEISLGSCWRRDILRGKSQALFTNCTFLWLCNMQSSSGNYSLRHQIPMVSSFSLSKCCCLHFCRNKFGLLLALGYFKGQRSRINHKLQLFMTLCDMQSLSGNYSMRHQVPMVFLLLLVYLSAVACISEERNLGPCLPKDILRVKGQAKIKNFNFLWVGAINMHLLSGHYMMCRQVSMSFFTSFTLSDYCCLHTRN